MMSTALASRIRRLIPSLASNFDGEVIATRNAIGRELAAAGSDWHALAGSITGIDRPPTNPPPRTAAPSSFADIARAVRDLDRGRLTQRERGFISQMCSLGFSRQPSERQLEWLLDIFARLRGRAAA